MILFVYNLFLPLLYGALRLLSLRMPSLREFLEKREGLLARWRKNTKPGAIWVHVSSVGELEQVRPVMEYLQKQNERFVLSYFSVSVPRLVKDWSFVEYADYLPLDFAHQMQELTEILKPKLLVLNRYDVWPNHLRALTKAKIPVALVNASTPPLGLWGQLSLIVRRTFFRKIHAWSFVDSSAAEAWEPYVRKDAKGLVAGNPRVDRAMERAEHALQLAKARGVTESWLEGRACIVGGSTWRADEELLLESFAHYRKQEKLALLLVPHEPTEENLLRLEEDVRRSGFSSSRFSQMQKGTDILLVDQRGFLAELYAFGFCAHIGGGFGREIHSVIEPIAHSIPVSFGPHFHRSPEAEILLSLQAAKTVTMQEAQSLADWWGALRSGEEMRRTKEGIRIFVQRHKGASARIGQFLLECMKQ